MYNILRIRIYLYNTNSAVSIGRDRENDVKGRGGRCLLFRNRVDSRRSKARSNAFLAETTILKSKSSAAERRSRARAAAEVREIVVLSGPRLRRCAQRRDAVEANLRSKRRSRPRFRLGGDRGTEADKHTDTLTFFAYKSSSEVA